jgi:hypothetical protein
VSAFTCAHDATTRMAAATGRWSETARAHAQSCRSCREVALVVTALAAPAEVERSATGDPGRLWVQGRVARRVRAEAQVSRVVLGVHVSIGLALAVLLAYAAVRLQFWTALSSPYAGPVALFAAVCVFSAAYLMTRRSEQAD